MNKINNLFLKSVLGVVLLMVVVSVAYKASKNSSVIKPAGALSEIPEERLQSNINAFMESQVSEYDIGKENYYCVNILYGYDSQYAYAWVYCSGFEINNNDVLEQGTAFSIPTRLEYKKPNFQIIDFKQPDEGSLYAPTLREIFPKKYYDIGHPSNAEIEKLDEILINKTKAVMDIKDKYPKFKDYPSDKLPPRSIKIEESQAGFYIAFVQNGSGRPIIKAQCFLVKPDSTILDNGVFTPTSNENLNFSAKECVDY